MVRVAIIGTAGRDKQAPLSRELFGKMCRVAQKIINDVWKLEPATVCLVSGGAAWVDHVAVSLYLQNHYPELELNLPCEFTDGRYSDTGAYDWRVNPGKTSNHRG